MGYAAKLGGKNFGSGAGPISDCTYGEGLSTKGKTQNIRVDIEYNDPDFIFGIFYQQPGSTGTPQGGGFGMTGYDRKLGPEAPFFAEGNWACYNMGQSAAAGYKTTENTIQDGYIWWYWAGATYTTWPNIIARYFSIRLDT